MLKRIPLFASLLALGLLCADGETVRVTTWNLEWFPDKSPKPASVQQEQQNIAAAAEVLRKLDSDILLLDLEGGSENHLMSSTGKYCVRELAAA